MDIKFGWKKDKFDKRDFIAKAVPVAVLPPVVVLDKYLMAVGNQGQLGSCVGWALNANLVSKAKAQDVFKETYSPTWIYNGARYLEGTLKYDDGCYPRDACEWLTAKGALLEQYWPYNPNKLDTTSPPSHLEKHAKDWPVARYYRVTGDVDGICSAIADGNFVSIGIPWAQKWMNSNGQLGSVKSSDSFVGGHEVTLYGYDRNSKIFLGINSWGTGWGANGLFTMPFSVFSVFKQIGGYDAHYLTCEWGKPPEPEPESVSVGARFQVTTDNATWINLWSYKGD